MTLGQRWTLVLVMFSVPMLAQPPTPSRGIFYVTTDPTGSGCGYSYVTVNRATGQMTACVNGTWAPVVGGSGPPSGSAGGGLSGTYPNPTVPYTAPGTGSVTTTVASAIAGISIPVTAYGAKSDNCTTDNAPLIQAAINYAHSLTYGGDVQLLAGTGGDYGVNSPIYLPRTGQNPSTGIVTLTGVGAGMGKARIRACGSGWTAGQGVIMRDVTSACASACQSFHQSISNLSIIEPAVAGTYGIHFSNLNPVLTWTITNNGASGCTTGNTITFSGGTPTNMAATATVAGGVVSAIVTQNQGQAYGGGAVTAPTVAIAQGTCAQTPTATIVLATSNQIFAERTEIQLNNIEFQGSDLYNAADLYIEGEVYAPRVSELWFNPSVNGGTRSVVGWLTDTCATGVGQPNLIDSDGCGLINGQVDMIESAPTRGGYSAPFQGRMAGGTLWRGGFYQGTYSEPDFTCTNCGNASFSSLSGQGDGSQPGWFVCNYCDQIHLERSAFGSPENKGGGVGGGIYLTNTWNSSFSDISANAYSGGAVALSDGTGSYNNNYHNFHTTGPASTQITMNDTATSCADGTSVLWNYTGGNNQAPQPWSLGTCYIPQTIGGNTKILGNLTLSALAIPSGLAATPVVAGGSSTWTYNVIACPQSSVCTAATSTGTLAQVAGTTTTGPSNITGSANGVNVTWTPVAGAQSYAVYRTAAPANGCNGSTCTNGLFNGNAGNPIQTPGFTDIGNAGDGTSVGTVNNTGVLSGGSLNATQVNGAVVPISTPILGSNSSGQFVSPVTMTVPANDTVCAVGSDTTVATQNLTGGSSTSSTITVSVSVTAGFTANMTIGVAGATPSGFNTTGVITSVTTNTSITFSNTNNPGAWVSGGNIYLPCGNSTNANSTAQPFATTFPIVANSLATKGLEYDCKAGVSFWTPSSATTFGLFLQYNGTSVNDTNNFTPANSIPGYNGVIKFTLIGNATNSAYYQWDSVGVSGATFTNTIGLIPQPFFTATSATTLSLLLKTGAATAGQAMKLNYLSCQRVN